MSTMLSVEVRVRASSGHEYICIADIPPPNTLKSTVLELVDTIEHAVEAGITPSEPATEPLEKLRAQRTMLLSCLRTLKGSLVASGGIANADDLELIDSAIKLGTVG